MRCCQYFVPSYDGASTFNRIGVVPLAIIIFQFKSNLPWIFIFVSILSPNNPGGNARVVSVRNTALTLVLFPN